MKVIFTKGAGKYDRMDVYRDGSECETIACPKQRIIPHDMVHHAVESRLRRRGFLSRLRDGEPAGFQMAGNAESDGVERLVEVFQGDGWSGGQTPAQDMIELYRITCEERRCPMLPVTTRDVDDIRDLIRQLTDEWEALAVGESLSLEH
jgi:hypothetical protein